MKRWRVLITNDDGIDSYFLRALVEACLRAKLEVFVAAPMGEQSWIGRAVSRYRRVHVAEYEHLGCPAWALDGTPTDCVNIALQHLLTERPHAVLSGINLGFNASMPIILSSGTIAGAIEGAAWGLGALAFSLQLPHGLFEEIRKNHGNACPQDIETSLQNAANHAAAITRKVLEHPAPVANLTVHNVNFPECTRPETPIVRTQPAIVQTGALFQREAPTSYGFVFNPETPPALPENCDVACLERGEISHTVLDYGALGRLGS